LFYFCILATCIGRFAPQTTLNRQETAAKIHITGVALLLCFPVLKEFLKSFKFFLFKINIFLDYFDSPISKIIFKK
jgi:hypothetical protein